MRRKTKREQREISWDQLGDMEKGEVIKKTSRHLFSEPNMCRPTLLKIKNGGGGGLNVLVLSTQGDRPNINNQKQNRKKTGSLVMPE